MSDDVTHSPSRDAAAAEQYLNGATSLLFPSWGRSMYG